MSGSFETLIDWWDGSSMHGRARPLCRVEVLRTCLLKILSKTAIDWAWSPRTFTRQDDMTFEETSASQLLTVRSDATISTHLRR